MVKILTLAEVRKMTPDDLRSDIAAAKNEAAKVRLGISLSKEKNTSQLPRLRRHIAQMMTVLNEKNPMRPRKPMKPTNKSSVSSESSVSSVSKGATKSSKSLSKGKSNTKLPAQA